MQHAFGDNLTPPDRAAAAAAVQWVLQPNEKNRGAAKAPSDAAPRTSVARALASAAYLTGGNIAPPGAPPMAPKPFDAAKAIALAVKLASIACEPVQIARMQRSYVELAIQIAEGRFV
jgi:hypothetical protein